MPLDLDQIKGPAGAGNRPVQAKYTLSDIAREKLRAAAEWSGHDMSTILELLIMQYLDVEGHHSVEPATTLRKDKKPEEPEPEQDKEEDFQFDSP